MDKVGLRAHIAQRGVSPIVADAFLAVDRAVFLPHHVATYAYEDHPLHVKDWPILSQPAVVALMLELSKLDDVPREGRILEIGSGSGYVLALLSYLVPDAHVTGLEIDPRFADISKMNLASFKYAKTHIDVQCADGYFGWAPGSPYDRIIVSASCEDMDPIFMMLRQVRDPGIIVCIVQDYLVVVTKKDGKTSIMEFPGFSFSPLVHDFDDDEEDESPYL